MSQKSIQYINTGTPIISGGIINIGSSSKGISINHNSLDLLVGDTFNAQRVKKKRSRRTKSSIFPSIFKFKDGNILEMWLLFNITERIYIEKGNEFKFDYEFLFMCNEYDNETFITTAQVKIMTNKLFELNGYRISLGKEKLRKDLIFIEK